MTASNRWLVIVAVATVALIAVSLGVALIGDSEADLAPSSPEGTVQAYLRSVADRDATAALAFYSDELASRCEVSQIRDSLRFGPDDFRATLGDVTRRGDDTEVVVRLTQMYGYGPFGRSESTFEQIFVLQETSEGWRFVEAPWPSWCPEPLPPASRSASLEGFAWR